MTVRSQDAWSLFVETGLPEYYLLYTNAKRLENAHVSDPTGPGAPGHGLQ